MLPIHFAPIQGYTDDIYRRTHNKIVGGVTCYYTPFVRVEADAIRSKDRRDIAPENNKNTPVVPQIIFSSRKEFEYLVDRVEALGYNRIDLNMGCPFPLQAKHGRGAGILPHDDIISDIVEGIKKRDKIKFSVKMRLGWDNPEEALKTIKILNNTKLEHVTIHPRLGIQQYKGTADTENFARLYATSNNPIIYNGDIQNTEDIAKIEEKFPRLAGIMIGRGLLGCPSMAYEYITGKLLSRKERIAIMLNIHDTLSDKYSEILNGDTQMRNKLRTYWEYSEELLGRKAYKKIMKSGNLKNYRQAVAELKFIE